MLNFNDLVALIEGLTEAQRRRLREAIDGRPHRVPPILDPPLFPDQPAPWECDPPVKPPHGYPKGWPNRPPITC